MLYSKGAKIIVCGADRRRRRKNLKAYAVLLFLFYFVVHIVLLQIYQKVYNLKFLIFLTYATSVWIMIHFYANFFYG